MYMYRRKYLKTQCQYVINLKRVYSVAPTTWWISIQMYLMFHGENFEAFLSLVMYHCGIHYFDNKKGVIFLYAISTNHV